MSSQIRRERKNPRQVEDRLKLWVLSERSQCELTPLDDPQNASLKLLRNASKISRNSIWEACGKCVLKVLAFGSHFCAVRGAKRSQDGSKWVPKGSENRCPNASPPQVVSPESRQTLQGGPADVPRTLQDCIFDGFGIDLATRHEPIWKEQEGRGNPPNSGGFKTGERGERGGRTVKGLPETPTSEKAHYRV